MKKRAAILICLTAMVLMGCEVTSDRESTSGLEKMQQSNQVTEEAATEELPEEYECGLVIKHIIAPEEQEDVIAPEAEAREVYEDLKSLPVEIQKVLYENGSFYEVYDQREYTRLDYEGTHYKRSTSQELAMWGHYIVLDFDGDGEKELAVTMREDHSGCFIEVFDVQENQVYAYENSFRGFIEVYTDGTLAGTSGASDNDYYKLKFNGNVMTQENFVGQNGDTWYLMEKEITEEEYTDYLEKRYGEGIRQVDMKWAVRSVEWSRKTIDETLDENR